MSPRDRSPTTDTRVDPGRPTGEEMLDRLRAEPGAGGRGGLRVYVGMAPGVGKTYTMLEEAHRRKERGADVVVGFVETHGRPMTAKLIEGLEILPRRQVAYRGVIVEEMDADAVMARRPAIALVDELAHANAPGSPREKRWQDVELIRDAGIQVISTLNVQHLESVAESVETITGAPVKERLPDEVLANATEIELIDMSPRALRQRMRHGNVYPPERVGVALDRFFTEANLTALREIALRVVARRVDEELDVTSRLAGLAGATERVLVLVDDTHAAHRTVRRAAEIAAALQGRLVAVSVETAASGAAQSDAQRRLREALDDAADLGAEVIRVAADDVASGLSQVARERRATHVVIPYHPRGRLSWLRGRSLADELVERLGQVELHLVAAREQ